MCIRDSEIYRVEFKSNLNYKKVANDILKIFGRIDYLINNASKFYPTKINDVSEKVWLDTIDTNIKAPLFLSKHLFKELKKRKGAIINIIDIHVEPPLKDHIIYNISKAGLLALTRSLAVELGKHNIRVNALGSGWYTAEQVPLEVQQEELLVRYTPLRRKGTPDDIGPLLVYLCSEACDYTTGQPVYVDGGLNAHP